MKLLIVAALAGTALSASAAPQPPALAGAAGCYSRLPGAEGAPMGAGGVWTLERGAGASAIWRFREGPGSAGPGPGWTAVDCATGRPISPPMDAGHAATPPGDVLTQAPPVFAPPAPDRERRAVIIRPAPRPHAGPVPPMAHVPAPAPHHPPMAHHGPQGGPPMAHHPAPPMAAPGPHHAPPPMAYGAPPPPMPPVVEPGPYYAPPPMAHHAPMQPMPPIGHPGPHYAPPPTAHHAPMQPMPPIRHPFPGGPGMEPGFVPPPPPAFAFPPEPVPAPAQPRWFGDRYLTWAGKPQ